MDEITIEIYAPTKSSALAQARAQAERAGFYVLRQNAEHTGGDPMVDLNLRYRVTLMGQHDGVWCPLRGRLVEESECVSACASPEQRIVCRMEREQTGGLPEVE